jgi:hypothetical protein
MVLNACDPRLTVNSLRILVRDLNWHPTELIQERGTNFLVSTVSVSRSLL